MSKKVKTHPIWGLEDWEDETDGITKPHPASPDATEPIRRLAHQRRLAEKRKKLGKPQVKLVGQDGNAWAIMGRVDAALREHGYTKEDIDIYQEDAMSGDYDHLLRVTLEWVDQYQESGCGECGSGCCCNGCCECDEPSAGDDCRWEQE